MKKETELKIKRKIWILPNDNCLPDELKTASVIKIKEHSDIIESVKQQTISKVLEILQELYEAPSMLGKADYEFLVKKIKGLKEEKK